MNLIKISAGAFQPTESLRNCTFDFNRFLNVARWNFAINRAQYLKMALSLFLIMAIPFLMQVMKTVWVMGVTKSTETAFTVLPLTGIREYIPLCYVVALPIICGYMFHNLLTKQSRIKELTLPASNAEKFLFYAILTLCGSLLVYVVSYFLIDLLQYFYVGIVYDFAHAEWIPYAGIFALDNTESKWFQAVVILAWLAFCSTFVLGNALKYRHNVIWTYVFHMVLGFVSMLLFGMSMPFLADHLEHFFTDMEINETGIKVAITVFFVLVNVFCWWMSYRLYCRAQITTLRNK